MVDMYREAAEVLRMVLAYLRALSPEGLMFGTQSSTSPHQYCRKSRRSIVRNIGSNLPLKPAKRICFQIVQNESLKRRNKPASFIDEDCDPLVVANLADIPWLDVCSPEKTVRRRSEFHPRKAKKTLNRRRTIHSFKSNDSVCTPRKALHSISEEWATPSTPDHKSTPRKVLQSISEEWATPDHKSTPRKVLHSLSEEWVSPATPDPKAMRKIDALEVELATLRAQIAMIVTVQQNQQPAGGNFAVATPRIPPLNFSLDTTGPPPPPPPTMMGGGPPMMGAPPPPPPPPPPMFSLNSKPIMSVAEQIRRNKAKNGKNGGTSAPGSKTGMPNMADVLKGLGTVKLKSIARSPGGTPIRKTPKACMSNDPAALIAQALKRKFARQRAEESPDKENVRYVPSPKKLTPVKESPKFGQHLLKPNNNKRKSNTRQSRPLVDVNA